MYFNVKILFLQKINKKMKKLILLSLLVALISCNRDNKNELLLKGDINGLKQGKIIIKRIVDTAFVSIDTILFDGKSQFETTINLKEPEVLYVFLNRGQTVSIDNSLMFFAEPGTMTFNTTLEKFYADAKFTGSKHHDVYDEYLKMKQKFTDKNIEWLNYELKNRGKSINLDSLNNLRAKNEKLKTLYALNFSKNNKDLHVAPFILISDVKVTRLAYLNEVYQSLTPKIAKGKYGIELKRIMEEVEKLNKND